MLLKKMAFISLLIASSFSLKAQNAESIIRNYINFTGGEKQWKKIHTMVSSGTYNYGGMEFPFEAYSKAPDLYKYIVSSNGKYFAQAFDGHQGWKIDGFKDETNKTILSGKEARAMANEADVDIEPSFINYKKKGYQATLERKDSVNHIECYKIKMTGATNDTATYFFSTKDFSLLKKQATSKNAELDNSLLDTYYSDYIDTEGIKTAHKLISKVGDQTILTITVTKLQFNTTIDDNIFRP